MIPVAIFWTNLWAWLFLGAFCLVLSRSCSSNLRWFIVRVGWGGLFAHKRVIYDGSIIFCLCVAEVMQLWSRLRFDLGAKVADPEIDMHVPRAKYVIIYIHNSND